MNPTSNAARVGMRRGWTEFRKSLRAPEDLGFYVVGTSVFIVVMFLNRNNDVADTGMTVSQFIFPGVLAFIIVFSAFGLATAVTTEREDGTLLRAKSVPHGVVGYVVGQITRTTVEVFFNIALLAVPVVIILGDVWTNGILGLVHVLALVVLGLLACVSIGFVVGSVFKNPRSVGGWGMLVVGALVATSGILYPLDSLPGWSQPIPQVFPMYWLGLGMREAVLPESAVVVEIGESWRTLETFGVLGAWAVAGLLLAPVLLRRMARRESGSNLAARQQKALQRV